MRHLHAESISTFPRFRFNCQKNVKQVKNRRIRYDGKNIDKLENLPEYYSNNKDKKIQEINNRLFNSKIEGDVCVNFCWAAIFLTNNKIIDKVGLFDEK